MFAERSYYAGLHFECSTLTNPFHQMKKSPPFLDAASHHSSLNCALLGLILVTLRWSGFFVCFCFGEYMLAPLGF